MRRVLLLAFIALFVSSSTLLGLPSASGHVGPNRVRDVGPLVGFRRHESSYSVAVGDANADGWEDVLIVHHGSTPSELFVNQPWGDGTLGFEVVARLVDTIHGRTDRHGCVFGDPNVDGLTDILCLKGANQGYSDKWNELWIQGPEGTWTDRAASWGVEDIWGRGRRPAWIDLNGDGLPDLFIGNDTPRHDEHGTPNRLYVNVDGESFREVDMGITREDGAACVQVADVDLDGRDDLLLCGKEELLLYVREGRSFVRSGDLGVPATPPAVAAEIVDVSGDGVDDLVLVRRDDMEVRLGLDEGFGPPVLQRPLAHGHGVAVGDVDGDHGPDIYVVNGCVDRVNAPDELLLNAGDGRSWTPVELPPLPEGELAGCGDTAEMIDFDRDGWQDVVVLNGGGTSQPLDLDGPDQLLTMGDWEPLA